MHNYIASVNHSTAHVKEGGKVGLILRKPCRILSVLMCMYPVHVFVRVCLRTPACVHKSVCALCRAPPVSQMLHCFTKQITANQIRALSSEQTWGEEWRNSVCVCVCVCVCVWRRGLRRLSSGFKRSWIVGGGGKTQTHTPAQPCIAVKDTQAWMETHTHASNTHTHTHTHIKTSSRHINEAVKWKQICSIFCLSFNPFLCSALSFIIGLVGEK